MWGLIVLHHRCHGARSGKCLLRGDCLFPASSLCLSGQNATWPAALEGSSLVSISDPRKEVGSGEHSDSHSQGLTITGEQRPMWGRNRDRTGAGRSQAVGREPAANREGVQGQVLVPEGAEMGTNPRALDRTALCLAHGVVF